MEKLPIRHRSNDESGEQLCGNFPWFNWFNVLTFLILKWVPFCPVCAKSFQWSVESSCAYERQRKLHFKYRKSHNVNDKLKWLKASREARRLRRRDIFKSEKRKALAHLSIYQIQDKFWFLMRKLHDALYKFLQNLKSIRSSGFNCFVVVQPFIGRLCLPCT